MEKDAQDSQQQTMDAFQVIRNRFSLILISFLLVFITAAVITYLMPRKYLGKVQMTIERSVNKLSGNKNMDDVFTPSDVVVRNQIETITKAETLYPMIDQMQLVKKWNLPSRQAALGRLQSNLDVQSSLKTDFVAICCYDTDSKMAADLANGVAASYMKSRSDIESSQKKLALENLKIQIAKKEEERSIARAKMQEAKKKAGIVAEWSPNDPSAAAGSTIHTSDENMVTTREQALLNANIELQNLSAELEQLEKLSTDELVARAAGLKLENSNVSGMMAKYSDLQVEIQGLSKQGLGRRHPQIRSVESQIETLKNLILNEARAHIGGLRSRVAAATKLRDSLQSSNSDAKKELLDQQSSYNDFKEAKDELFYLETTLNKQKDAYYETEASLKLVKAPATIYAAAEPEARPSKPNVLLNLSIGAVMGLFFGLGLAFFLEYMDTSVKSMDDVEKFLGVPVLAVIPKNVGVLHRISGFNPDAEAYRILRTNIEFNRRDAEANCITVTSGGAGEGKSTTLCNLATVCAQGGYSVLLIDADLRRPRMHQLFDVSNSVGLTNYLTTNVRLEDVVVRTPVENLYFLPSGMLPADSAGVLNSQRMSELIADVKSRFDLVLIDSPPILGVSDGAVLSNEADLTLLVVQHRKLPRQMLLRVKQTVENVGGRIVGVVLNNVDIRSDAQYQYYTSYYTYYSPNNNAADGQKKRRRSHPDEAPAPAAAPTAGGGEKVGDLF
jgi:polysaccharide biosynthesis transport protein